MEIELEKKNTIIQIRPTCIRATTDLSDVHLFSCRINYRFFVFKKGHIVHSDINSTVK